MRFLSKGNHSCGGRQRAGARSQLRQGNGDILSDLKPEAVYYCAEHGQRTIYFVVDLAETHQISAIAEPLWLSLKANVEAMPAISRAVERY